MTTLKELKAKLLEALRLDIYLKKSFDSADEYEQGREDAHRNTLVWMGYDKRKLMTVKHIDELIKEATDE